MKHVTTIGRGAAFFVLRVETVGLAHEPLKERFCRGHDFFLRSLGARDPIQICDKNFQRIFCHWLYHKEQPSTSLWAGSGHEIRRKQFFVSGISCPFWLKENGV